MSVQRRLERAWKRFRGVHAESPVSAADPDLNELPAGFDVLAYIALNPDLAEFKADPHRAVDHYLQAGRLEGRPYKLEVDRYGQLPADFDAETYVDLYADLEQLRGNKIEVATHYLREGRSEGRSYKLVAIPIERAAGGGTDQQSSPRDWTTLFSAADFRALRPDLAGTSETREQAVTAFLERGVDQLVPLATGIEFDPAFYAARYEDAARLKPAEAYRHWLFEGLAAGRPGSESQALELLLGISEYPDAFDWERYVEALPPSWPEPRWTRLSALEHLLQTGLAQGIEIPIKGTHSGRFLEAISAVLWKRRRRKAAFQLLERALCIEPASGALHHRIADRYAEIGDWQAAEHHEQRAFELGETSVLVFTRMIDLATQRGDFEQAYAKLRQSQAHCSGFAPWRKALVETIERDFACSADRVWTLYRESRREEADRLMESTLTRITDAFQTLDDLPGFVGPVEDGHVVMFANHHLPQCRHYRVEQRCRQLDHLGLPHRVFDSDEAEKAREALVGARALIVYREPAFPATIKLILHARALGVPVFYDIDDLIFDPDYYPDDFEVYEKQIPFEEYVGLLYGTPLLRFSIKLCDAGIASTAALARHVEPLTIGRLCHVVPNGLDDRNDRFLRASVPKPGSASRDEREADVFIFYGSGAKAHNRNFNETVGPALVELLAARPRVKLVVVGYLDLDPNLDPFADRILRFNFSKNLAAYWALLSEVDINLAVLIPSKMNDCKSEIKWLEAAVSGVPSIVSASECYRDVLNDGVDAMVARSPAEWLDALFRLVDDTELRRSIGARARERAIVDYSLEVTAAKLGQALMPGGSAKPRAARRPTRVLVVNVFFPPQTTGGATRVVRDNVDDLLDRYGEEFEVAAFSTDFDALHPLSRVGHYRSIPVFRCSRNTSTEFDYQDEFSADHFGATLRAWKPDLVHFHCVQFLTGSIVEACREEGVPYAVTAHDAWWISPHQFLIDDDFLLRWPAPRGISEPSPGLHQIAEIDRKRFLADQLAGAAAITAVSESFAELYRRAGFPSTRALPNGLSPGFSGRQAKRQPRTEGRVRIGHLGGHTRHKGAYLLQIALQSHSFQNLEAVVVDHNEPPTFERRLFWGMTPVTFRGGVPQDQVAALYGSLDVLIAPSIWPESYGLVSREALAMGLWVVASDLGAIGEDVVEGENGFRIDVRDASDLVGVLQRIDADPATYRSPPRRLFRPRMATEQTDDLVALYREIAGLRRRDDAAAGVP